MGFCLVTYEVVFISSDDEITVGTGHRTSNVSISIEVDFEYIPHLESEISEIESDIGRPSYEFVVEKLLGKEMFREIWRSDAEDKGGADSINEEADDENEEGVEGFINEEAEDANNEEADDTNTEEADQAKKSDEDVLFDAATFNFDQDLMLESSSDDEVEQVKVNNSATRTSRKRKNFEVSSSSNAAPKRRKVLTTMEGNEAANSTQNINEDTSQPVTQNAPLHSSQLQTQQSQSKSNAGNWSTRSNVFMCNYKKLGILRIQYEDFISTYKNANEKINKF
ncbi:hypothetical protein ACOSQ2_028643 [Xanthoceras sorbifolium]